jgi:DNA-binding XRE family transcriptional regulator
MKIVPIDPIKQQLDIWLYEHIFEARKKGHNISKAQLARIIGVATSSFNQYTNLKCLKKVPWQFQYKFCKLLGKPMECLHPEIEHITQQYKKLYTDNIHHP